MDTIIDKITNMSRNTKITILVIAAVLLSGCCLIFSIYGFINTTRNEGIAKENSLNGQYLDNQNELSSYISGFYEHIGITQAAGSALDQILLDAVKGRYDEGGFGTGSPLFVAIAEAYPEAGVSELMTNWGKIQDYITAGRESYKAKQSKLIDMLRAYDTWRETGLVKSAVIRTLGFPSQNLKARVGEMVFTGQPALDKMYQIVLTKQALDAYNSGSMDPLAVPTPGK